MIFKTGFIFEGDPAAPLTEMYFTIDPVTLPGANYSCVAFRTSMYVRDATTILPKENVPHVVMLQEATGYGSFGIVPQDCPVTPNSTGGTGTAVTMFDSAYTGAGQNILFARLDQSSFIRESWVPTHPYKMPTNFQILIECQGAFQLDIGDSIIFEIEFDLREDF